MNKPDVPINKGNYSMDTVERESLFERHRGYGWEEGYADYRSKWKRYAQEQYVSDYPLLVDIELSSLCNLACPMCYTITDAFKRNVNTTLMDWELYRKIIEEIRGNVPAIRLSLRGESFLHPRFIDAVSYAKTRGIKEISTLTNGSKLTLSYFIQIAEAGMDWITISVDGIGATYDRLRKPLKFNDLYRNLKAIKEYKDRHQLKRPVIKVQGIWPAIAESGVESYYATLSPWTDLVSFNPLIDYLDNDIRIEYLEEFICPQQYQRLVIGADGLVMKCSNDEDNRDVIGNIAHESVYQIWHGEKMEAVRTQLQRPRGFMENTVCRKCYLPRKTQDEPAKIGERTFIVRNYVHRSQEIGK